MKKIWLALPVLLLCFSAAARAQGGIEGSGECTVDSPENPTIILAMAGSIGATGAMLRARISARRKK